jgi:heme oxygenase
MTTPEVKDLATTETGSIMARLRAETAQHHERAENQPFQKRLVRGEVTPAQYATWISQLLTVHTALEAELDKRLGDPRFAAVSRSQFKVSLLESDLGALAIEQQAAFPQTCALCDRISEDAVSSPTALLGHHYVLEGSTNGNRFVAKKLAKVWGEAKGLSYLDPYGEAQRSLWQDFRLAMDQVVFTPTEGDEIVRAAGEMFDGIAQISQAMP